MANFLVIIPMAGIGLVSLVNWIAAWNTRMILYYITKPIVLLGLILYLVFRVPITSARLPFLIGLIFSLIGDIFLIPKGTRWFLAGVGAFSVTQVMYIWGFNLSRAELPAMIVGAVAYLGGVVLTTWWSIASRNLPALAKRCSRFSRLMAPWCSL